MPTDIQGLLALLEENKLRYVIVGGLALVLRGVDRLTADVDIAADLAPGAAERLVDVLSQTGYRPMAPVDPKQLADADHRENWRRERHMQVFSFWDSTGRRPTIDVFIAPPVPFEELWQDATRVEVAAALRVPVASVSHLIRLKEEAGRPQDLADIERLRKL